MVDLINYIRNLIFAPTGNRKRRAPLEEFEIPISPKIRRVSASQMSNNVEDDWHSISSSDNFRHRRALHNSSLGTKLKPSWCKENVTVTVDDDDEVIEVPKIKQRPSVNPLKTAGKAARFTSTPHMSSSQRPSFHQNGDDDITFLKYTLSSEEKKLNAKKQGFDYIKPFSYVNDNQHKGRSVMNGHNHDLTSPVLSSAKGSSSRFTLKKRPSVHNSMLEQTFRLDEKAKYQELLTQAVTTSTNLRDSFAKYASPSNKFFTFGVSNRGKKLVDMAIGKGKPAAVIDLTANDTDGKERSRLTTKETIKKVLSDFENEPVTVKDSDSDVEILPAPPSPKPDIQVERVNSLKKIIDTSEHVHDEWLKKLVQKHKDNVANYEREIRAQTEQRKKLGAVTSEVYQQRLEEQMQKCLHIKDAVLPIQCAEETVFPELTEEEEERIDIALNKRGNPNEIVAQKFNLNITRRDIQTLAGLNWLNDEVINFYMNLIIERGKDPKWPKAYAMNTFFYPKLQKDGPSSLRRWTRRVDVFSYDLIAVPIHLGVHWCMSIIDFSAKTIKYYDSMGSTNRQCLEALLNYLQAEHLDKKQMEFDVSGWALESVPDIPQQMNGSDCGMFSCTFAEFITRNAKITFSQEDMPYLRRKMVLEILNGELLIK